MRKSVITRWYFWALRLIPGRAAVADGIDFEPVGFEDLAEMMAIELHVVDDEDSAFHHGSSILVKNRLSR